MLRLLSVAPIARLSSPRPIQMRRVTAPVVATALVGALGACSGGDPELSFSPTPFASAPPTPSPTPTVTEPVDESGVVMDLSDPQIGFELVDVPTDLEGDEADVYSVVALFEREYWRGMTMNEVSPLLQSFTAPNVIASLEEIADDNGADGAQISGTFRATITGIVVDEDAATASVCDDYDATILADKDGPHSPEEVGFSPPIKSVVTVARGAEPGLWRIVRTEGDGRC